MRNPSAVLSLLILAWATRLGAIDHDNLDEGRPLEIEDAYAIAEDEWVFESGVGYSLENESRDRAYFPIQTLYGAAPNFQVELGSQLSTNPHDIHEPEKSGDLQLGSLYNFNQETEGFPAFGIKGSLNLPSGVDSAGVDFELKGLMTKSFGRFKLHFNPAYQWLSGEGRGGRDGRYKFVLGGSYPVGAPMHTRTLVLGEVFVKQSPRRNEGEVFGIGVGVRYQLSERVVLDLGMGGEIAGPADRALFFTTAGFSMGF